MRPATTIEPSRSAPRLSVVAEPTSIAELGAALTAGRTSSETVTRACLDRIDLFGPPTNAFITVLRDQALEAARAADEARAHGRVLGPLHGVPISLKDIIDVRGVPTTAASAVRRGHIAGADAVVVERLRAAGAVIVGKTNLHEFALGPTNDDSAYGPVRHPRDEQLSSGGSSGGSAVSVVTGMAWGSIGTDTGGSIRIPAAACGVVGLKPSIGEVPTDGVVPLSPTFDHVGPLCRTVADARLLFEVLTASKPSAHAAPSAPRGLRLGVPRAYFLDHVDPAVAASFERACGRLMQSGVTIEAVTIPHVTDTAPIYVTIALAEAAEYHASTIAERPGDYHPTVRIRLEAASYILAEDYLRAHRGRRVLDRRGRRGGQQRGRAPAPHLAGAGAAGRRRHRPHRRLGRLRPQHLAAADADVQRDWPPGDHAAVRADAGRLARRRAAGRRAGRHPPSAGRGGRARTHHRELNAAA